MGEFGAVLTAALPNEHPPAAHVRSCIDFAFQTVTGAFRGLLQIAPPQLQLKLEQQPADAMD
jgi:hypothetical protein